MRTSGGIWWPITLALAVGVARGAFECLGVASLVPDPQTPIWIMFSLVTSVFIVVTVLAAALVARRGLRSERPLVRGAAALPLLLLLGWYAIGFANLATMRSALLDAADPATGPERLRALAAAGRGPGYEIDNRVARHSHTPPDVLRSLHGRPDQVGTEICLAANPRTPDDVLRAIAARDDEWTPLLQSALRGNPRHAEVFPGQAAALPPPLFRASLLCSNGADGSGSGCSITLAKIEGGLRVVTGQMRCGFVGAVSELTWTYRGREGAADLYHVVRRFPEDAADTATTDTLVRFTGARQVLFDDGTQCIVIEQAAEPPGTADGPDRSDPRDPP